MDAGKCVVLLYIGVTVNLDLVAEVSPCKVGTACRPSCEEPIIAVSTPIPKEAKGKNRVTTMYVGGLVATPVDVSEKGWSNAFKSDGLSVVEPKLKSHLGVVAGNLTDTTGIGIFEYPVIVTDPRENRPEDTDSTTATPGSLGPAKPHDIHEASYKKTEERKKLTPLAPLLTAIVGLEAKSPAKKGYANPLDEAMPGIVSLCASNMLKFTSMDT